MLTAIKRIKGFGVFGDFTAPADLPAFARYNIIYGENGSGKTTLSRLFAALEAGTHTDYADLEYTIESQSGTLSAGQRYGRKIRTFNADYVEANIGQFHGPLRHILIIGEENKALAEEAAAERATYDERSRTIAAAERAAERLDTERGKVFSAIAKTIGEATSGSTLRSYRKPNAEADFANERDLMPLSDAQLEAHRATVHQEQLECVAVPVLPLQPGDPARPFTDVAAALPAEIAARRAGFELTLVHPLGHHADDGLVALPGHVRDEGPAVGLHGLALDAQDLDLDQATVLVLGGVAGDLPGPATLQALGLGALGDLLHALDHRVDVEDVAAEGAATEVLRGGNFGQGVGAHVSRMGPGSDIVNFWLPRPPSLEFLPPRSHWAWRGSAPREGPLVVIRWQPAPGGTGGSPRRGHPGP